MSDSAQHDTRRLRREPIHGGGAPATTARPGWLSPGHFRPGEQVWSLWYDTPAIITGDETAVLADGPVAASHHVILPAFNYELVHLQGCGICDDVRRDITASAERDRPALGMLSSICESVDKEVVPGLWVAVAAIDWVALTGEHPEMFVRSDQFTQSAGDTLMFYDPEGEAQQWAALERAPHARGPATTEIPLPRVVMTVHSIGDGRLALSPLGD